MEFQTDSDGERPEDVPALCGEKITVVELIELLSSKPIDLTLSYTKLKFSLLMV